MKINRLRIANLYSYSDAELLLDDFNLIVGPNGSGKSNILRVLEILAGDPENRLEQAMPLRSLDDISLERQLKYDPERGSSILLDINLSDDELRVLLQFLFRRAVRLIANESIRRISVILFWPKSPDPLIRQSLSVVRFGNGFSVFRRAGKDRFAYVKQLPDDIFELADLHTMYERMDSNVSTAFTRKHNFSTNALPHEDVFQQAFLNGVSLEGFFDVDGKLYSLEFENQNLSYQSESPVDFVIDIFRFSKIPKDWVHHSTSIWLILKALLSSNISFLKDVRPSIDDLADRLFKLKNVEGFEQQYEDVQSAFANFFPEVTFDVKEAPVSSSLQTSENSGSDQGDGRRIHLIKIRDKHGIVNIKNSASGYFETLCIFTSLTDTNGGLSILDEPALNLHPTKINQLSRILMQITSKQVVLVTHSPYFVDPSTLSIGRRLIYVRRLQDGTSKIYQPLHGTTFEIKSYLFHPEIFFASCNVFVEGAGDSLSLLAVSDAFDGLFQKGDVALVDMMGSGNIENYYDIITKYELPHVAMVDSPYGGRKTNDFFELEGKLEHELKKFDASVDTTPSIDAQRAYNIVFDTMQSDPQLVRDSGIGRVIDSILLKLKLSQEEYWSGAFRSKKNQTWSGSLK